MRAMAWSDWSSRRPRSGGFLEDDVFHLHDRHAVISDQEADLAEAAHRRGLTAAPFGHSAEERALWDVGTVAAIGCRHEDLPVGASGDRHGGASPDQVERSLRLAELDRMH